MNYIKDTTNIPIVQVVMATYNGEQYIEEQIISIFQQKGCQVRLFIRDDGSTDQTVKIIEKLKQIYDINLVSGSHLGSANGFLQALKQVGDADYYAFSDQDDIWESEKLYVAIKQLALQKAIPALYASNLYIMRDGVPSQDKMWDDDQIFITEYKRLLINHTSHMFGCSMVFNRALRNIVIARLPQHPRMHDEWVGLVASLTGNIIYDKQPHIYHRIHQKNVVGDFSSLKDVWRWRWQRIRGEKKGEMERQAQDILNCMPKNVLERNNNENYTRVVCECNRSFINKIRYIKMIDCSDMRFNQRVFHVLLALLGRL